MNRIKKVDMFPPSLLCAVIYSSELMIARKAENNLKSSFQQVFSMGFYNCAITEKTEASNTPGRFGSNITILKR